MSNVTNKEIVIVDENNIKDKIYLIRGQKVMLDFDLAEIYGYSTKVFNQQINRNIEIFPDGFMFQITRRNQIIWWGHKLWPREYGQFEIAEAEHLCLMHLSN